jgi:predicted O-methyltransferase YrrM
VVKSDMGLRKLSHALRDRLRIVRKDLRHALRIDRLTAATSRSPIWIVMGGMWHTPARARMKFFRCTTQRLPLPPLSSNCEINSVHQFGARYARLAAALGQERKSSPPGELEFLAAVEKRRCYYKGAIAPADALFLTAFVSILSPRRVVEIGTLTGFSAGMIAAALARRHGSHLDVRVDTIDIHAESAVDPKQPTGFEIGELFSQVAATVRVHTPRDSSFVAQLAGRNELELAFIDADHRHPLPLLDLLRLAPYIQPASWILLHDVRLGTLTQQALDAGRKTPFEPVFGAEWLFNEWRWRKISGGNIGAVQLPPRKSALVPFALRMMRIPSEISQRQTRATRRALYEAVAALC